MVCFFFFFFSVTTALGALATLLEVPHERKSSFEGMEGRALAVGFTFLVFADVFAG